MNGEMTPTVEPERRVPMAENYRTRLPHVPGLLLTCVLFMAAALAPGDPVGAGEPLTLRVQDAIAPPGGVVAFVLRTYASRPIGQGQLCLMANPVQSQSSEPEITAPLVSLLGAVVFSQAGDAQLELVSEVSDDPQMIMVHFVSDSGTINSSDGPLAALFFRLDESVPPGSRFRLVVDAPNSLLRDPVGNPIVIEPREGELITRLPADPFSLQADGTRIEPGQIADLAISTLEPFPMVEGQIVLRYDATIARGEPTVRMDPRHGQADFEVDTSSPGMIVVNFSSTAGDLNYLPGDLIQIDLPTSRQVAPGLSSPVWLDSAMTWVASVQGQLLSFTLEDDLLEFVRSEDGGGRGSITPIEIERIGTDTGTEAPWRAPGRTQERGTTRVRH